MQWPRYYKIALRNCLMIGRLMTKFSNSYSQAVQFAQIRADMPTYEPKGSYYIFFLSQKVNIIVLYDVFCASRHP